MGRKGNVDRGIYLRRLPSGHTRYYIRFAWHGRDVRLSGGSTKEEARRTLNATLTDLRRGDLELPPTPTATVAGAIERYRPFAQALRNYRKAQCFFEFWTDRLGSLSLQKLTPTHLEQAQRVLLEQALSPATVNRYTDWFRHILNREVRLGHLAKNPASRIRRLPEPEAPIHQYSAEQETALLKELGRYGPYVRFAILTGLRQAEQFGIEKAWIHWEAGLIQIPTSKTRRPRIVLLTEEVRAIVHQLCCEHPMSRYVFPSPRFQDRPMNPGAFYRKIFRPACEKVGIPVDLKWHSLRHTFGSRLAASGASAKQIQALGGWSTDRAASRYIHLCDSDLLRVAELLSPKRSGGTSNG